MDDNAVMILFAFIVMAVIVGVLLFISGNLTLAGVNTNGLLTQTQKNVLLTVQGTAAGVFDNSFFYMIIVVLILDVVFGYMMPDRFRAIINLMFLFSLPFVIPALQSIGNNGSVINVLGFNLSIPKTVAFFQSPALIFLIAVMLILSIIFNMRTSDQNDSHSSEFHEQAPQPNA